MSLESWLQSGYLLRHQATVAEVRKLLGLVDRELSDAAVQGLSSDGRFMHAYDAALQLCTIALHVSGYAVNRRVKGHHAYTINSLEHTLGQQQTSVYLSTCSTQRHHSLHHSLYDHAGVVSEQDAQDLLQTARQLRTEVLDWLRANHPNLLPPGY
jgi:hypothetical protein